MTTAKMGISTVGKTGLRWLGGPASANRRQRSRLPVLLASLLACLLDSLIMCCLLPAIAIASSLRLASLSLAARQTQPRARCGTQPKPCMELYVRYYRKYDVLSVQRLRWGAGGHTTLPFCGAARENPDGWVVGEGEHVAGGRRAGGATSERRDENSTEQNRGTLANERTASLLLA